MGGRGRYGGARGGRREGKGRVIVKMGEEEDAGRLLGLAHSIGSWYELVVELLQDLSGDDGVIELHKTVPRHRAAEGEWTRDFHTVMLTCSHADTDCRQCTIGLGELCWHNFEHRHINMSIISVMAHSLRY